MKLYSPIKKSILL